MHPPILRGILQKCNQKQAFDPDGNEYLQSWVTISGSDYTARLPKDLYLEVGMEVIAARKEAASTELISGYCLKTGRHWGENWKALKAQTDPIDGYTLVQGPVTEKRKSTDGAFDMERSILHQTRTSFTILVGEQRFHASEAEGEWLKIGMDIAAVVKGNDAVLIMDKQSGRFHQVTRPYFGVFLGLIGALVAGKMYLVKTGSQVLPMYAVIVLGIFLVLLAVLNLLTYRIYLEHRRFLRSKIGR